MRTKDYAAGKMGYLVWALELKEPEWEEIRCFVSPGSTHQAWQPAAAPYLPHSPDLTRLPGLTAPSAVPTRRWIQLTDPEQQERRRLLGDTIPHPVKAKTRPRMQGEPTFHDCG